MRKQVTKTVHCCDKCKKEIAVCCYTCLKCGTELCYECSDKHGITYQHGVYLSGSGDGFYCKACDAKLVRTGQDKLYNAYKVIQALRQEGEAWSRAFRKSCDDAEALVKRFSTD